MTNEEEEAEEGGAEAIDEAFLARARVIAGAFARTAEHHRRTALIAGLIALAGCGLAFAADRPAAKGAALFVGVLFAVFCYRATRAANNYIDPTASPVLRAITSPRGRIRSVELTSDPSRVTIRTEDASLEVRIDEDCPAEPLLEALAAHVPEAEIRRD